MRKRFEAQLTLGSIPIEKVAIPTKSRDEFPPFLRATVGEHVEPCSTSIAITT
jgi:hypothetical protein